MERGASGAAWSGARGGRTDSPERGGTLSSACWWRQAPGLGAGTRRPPAASGLRPRRRRDGFRHPRPGAHPTGKENLSQEETVMGKKTVVAKYAKMTGEQLAAATAEFEREMAVLHTKPLTPEERRWWNQVR